MIDITLSMLANVTGGKLLASEKSLSNTINELVTDSRAIINNSTKNTAFLALKGPNFDGHFFAKQVVEQGCKLLIVDHQIKSIEQKAVAQLIVSDTRIALGKIAAFVKAEVAPKTVGITGSSGKTTVKEMVAAILSRLGKVLATNGNFNNDIGVPLTLLRLDHSIEFAVIEMGANHIGEIAYTTGLTKPDVAVINNIAAAHLEGFGDLCGVARAKGEIFSGLTEGGIALYNQDTKYTDKWQWRLTDKKVKTFSCVNKAHCYSENVHLDDSGCATFTLQSELGSIDIELPIPGKHNVCNAVAAASIAIEFGASIDDIRLGLAKMEPVKGRLNLYQLVDKRTGCKIKIIDDSYNANLESAKAAAQLLSNYPGKKLLILGDMGELGSEARSYHQEIGEFAKSLQLHTLLSLGVLSQSASDAFRNNNKISENTEHFNQRKDLTNHVYEILTQYINKKQQDIAILIKGSRSAHMEHVVTSIIQWLEQMDIKQVTEPKSSTIKNQDIEGKA
ncbi:UDP-N-acetylmuramoyl-tripeptide--D-alanyl-D-alanine ligase [Colwelliaceae bacterium MEBiC 14330]